MRLQDRKTSLVSYKFKDMSGTVVVATMFASVDEALGGRIKYLTYQTELAQLNNQKLPI